MLVWTGAAAVPPPATDAVLVRACTPDAAPLTYTPPHLTDKILAACPALARSAAGHRAVCRPQGLYRTHPWPRPRSRAAALDPVLQRMMGRAPL